MKAQKKHNPSPKSPSSSFWCGKRVLVTGHTGFKGGWLAFWLSELGAEVSGLALDSLDGRDIFSATDLGSRIHHKIGDIRDNACVTEILAQTRPEIIFHLAAQALVRRAHSAPEETYSTNVTGLTNVLEAINRVGATKAAVVATSDKVYDNREVGRPFLEDDPLGGVEPYGVSKAIGEFVCEAFRRSLPQGSDLGVATVRAGNVFGGGDWAADRLIPDAISAFLEDRPFAVRNPKSTRPWQHVFDPLAGYISVAERLFEGGPQWRTAWNFGPDGNAKTTALTVGEIADRLVAGWNRSSRSLPVKWQVDSEADAPYEAKLLSVNSAKAINQLNWNSSLSLQKGLDLTLAWYLAQRDGEEMATHSRQSLNTIYPLD